MRNIFFVTGTTTEEYLTTTEAATDVVSTVKTSFSSVPPTTSVQIVYKETATTIPTTTKPSTTTKPPTTTTTKKPSTKTTATKRPTLPTIRFITQPTQPVIVKKVLPLVTKKPTKPTPKFVFVKPKKTDTKDEIDSNDIMPMPTRKDIDEELIVTSPPKVFQKEIWGDRLDSPNVGNFSEKDKFMSVKAPVSAGYNVVLVVISVLGIAVLTTVVAVVLVRRYKCNHRRMLSSNGDSQSDVRFLTSDEVLDFSLDKDYDSL